jgi:SAM-dependent methyltransferase
VRDDARRGRRTPPAAPPPAREAGVIWHEVECGAYVADLPLWEELAERAGDPILDLGCGTGRVLSHLARREYEIRGLDLEPSLVASLDDTEVGDAREFELGERFRLTIAPMQLIQLFADTEERKSCLRCVAAHLHPAGLAAFAIVESMPEPMDAASPLPDTREVDGWVYSSLPIDAYVDANEIRVRRLRQLVSPAGGLSEDVDEVVLRTLDAATLEAEAESVGLRPAGRRAVPASEDHVGSTVVLLQKES